MNDDTGRRTDGREMKNEKRPHGSEREHAAARIETARRLLRDHHADIRPDAAFADRVVARLPQASPDLLGWAALKLLPATLLVAVVLGWLAWQATVDPGTAQVSSPTEDLLSWVIENGDG
jgi:hypothetical protein